MEPMAYFPHDANAATDSKCLRLLKRGRWAAYGRWMRVCELLAGETGHHLPFSTDEDVEVLGDQLGLRPKQCREFVATLADVGLIDAEELREGRTVFSDRMWRNAEFSGQRKSAARSRWSPKP